MTLSRTLCATVAAVHLCALSTQAAEPDDAPRLLMLGTEASQMSALDTESGLSVVALDTLPAPETVNEQVLAAILRANPVSTMIASQDSSAVRSGPLHLVGQLALGSDQQGLTARIGDTTAPLAEVLTRLEALIAALDPAERQIAYLHVADPEDRLPAALDQIGQSLDRAGMAMTVLLVGEQTRHCDTEDAPLEYAILGGLADREPFGDGNGATTLAEAVDWITRAVTRRVKREQGCAARYSLILRGSAEGGTLVARHQSGPLVPSMENALGREAFRALFLRGSDDPDQIAAYLDSCLYCPHEDELDARLQDISNRQMAVDLETEIWASIRDDQTGDRLKVYLEHCDLCRFEDEAKARLASIAAAAAARAEETARFQELRASRDLNGLQQWRDTCIACDQKSEAEALIKDLLADGRITEEAETLDRAISAQNAGAIRDWLDNCEICAARDTAQAALDRLDRALAAATPCLRAAGLPQQGGPRLLSQIDPATARATCKGVLAEHPDNPAVQIALGRIAQAEGDMQSARAAYDTGIAADRPEAFGLAAYAAFAPGEGAEPDIPRAEQLAQQGVARGDWLSGEVLTLLYLRDLVAGKSAADAYPIARAHAEDGNPVAQFFMGYFYNGGIGVESSAATAADWFGKAVDQGYLHANSFLAAILETGAEGVPADPDRAADLYWQALTGRDDTALQRLTDQIGERPNAIIREVQNRLQTEGVFRGRVDGIPGPRTIGAVERFAALQDSNEN